ncbi:hypothetical protein JB92DRAFT_2983248 [Gautieria morchelliformis]|nr:hypothetical protein JB92DRAFT_2983248 [Gautieria morchelliformis]
MTSSAVAAGKKALRSSLRKALSSIPSDEIQFQSGLVCSYVASDHTFQRAQVVSCYLSMPSGEVDTSRLVTLILESGKMLFVPRIDHERGEIDMLRIYDEQDLMSLTKGTWGIPEPSLERNSERRQNITDLGCPMLDLILLPGLGFDQTLSRLGHGKGYYDRFLNSYQSCIAERHRTSLQHVKMPTLWGLSLTQQLLDPSKGGIPIMNHDWKVDDVFHPGGSMMQRAVS